MMHAIPISVSVLVLVGTYTAMAGSQPTPPAEPKPVREQPQASLERRLSEIDSQLAHLANYSPRGGAGSISYRSENHWGSNHTEWVQINLEQETPIDQIVLVPAIWRDTLTGFGADGFPVEFEIRTGTQPDSPGTVVARFDESDHLLPRIAPLIVPCPATTASWVRVEATQLSQRAFDDKYDLKFAELLVFNGTENVALIGKASSSHTRSASQRKRATRFLNDGIFPYLMDAAYGKQSIAVICNHAEEQPPAITIDLEAPYTINRIHLHAVDTSDILPLAFTGDLGIPGLLRIEGANQADFSDATLLLNNRHNNAYDAGPILTLPIPETTCRYIRLTQLKPYIDQAHGFSRPQIGFAEIELFSAGRNVALHKPAQINFELTNPARTSSALTDGRNFYGDILPIRIWLEQLALRHDLETERPLLMEELNRSYARQKSNLRRMSWLAALLAVATGFTILIDRFLRQRIIFKTRERIAANLHDELGANLHAIGLLGDYAKKVVDRRNSQKEWPELITTVDEIRALTEETGATARYCTNMLEAEGLYQDLPEEMKRISARLLADLEHEITFKNEEILHRMKPRRRIDLFLFYKESLTNIIRHSGATHVHIQLTAGSKEIRLTITDNGQGLNGKVPASLKRRARLLGGRVTSESSADSGTCIVLKLRLSRWLRPCQRSL